MNDYRNDKSRPFCCNNCTKTKNCEAWEFSTPGNETLPENCPLADEQKDD